MTNSPFDFHYTSAIVSRVAASLKDAALFQREIKEVMNVDKARRQHQDYIATLRYSQRLIHLERDFLFRRKLGLDVIELQSDETLPEGVFVEDTAVICDGVALICRPGILRRLKEVSKDWFQGKDCEEEDSSRWKLFERFFDEKVFGLLISMIH